MLFYVVKKDDKVIGMFRNQKDAIWYAAKHGDATQVKVSIKVIKEG